MILAKKEYPPFDIQLIRQLASLVIQDLGIEARISDNSVVVMDSNRFDEQKEQLIERLQTGELDGDEVVSVSGNTCKRGDVYARKEVTNPTRIVTSLVKVEGGTLAVVSVKTKEDIPKGKIFDCVTALKDVVVKAPVHIGDVVLADVAGTGVDVIATKNVL